MAFVYPITHKGTEEGITVKEATIGEALSVLGSYKEKGHLGFAFSKAADATQYLIAEQILTPASLQEKFPSTVDVINQWGGVADMRNPKTVIYESVNAICLLTEDRQPNTVLVGRNGKQLFPAPGK